MQNSPNFEKISRMFKTFAERECKGVSKLYYQLSCEVSEEYDLIKLAANCSARQPIPNLFFGAIHFLLLKDRSEKLADYYPSISNVESDEIPIGLVKEFCSRRYDSIKAVLKEKIVQTNAINRTAYLMPIASSIFNAKSAVNLIDIGTSSGLTMNFDKYEYDYGSGRTYGESRVKIESEILEGTLPHFSEIIKVGRRVGIDQNPLDLTLGDNSLWLKALIWPDLKARFERMKSAIQLAQQSKLEMYKGSELNEFRRIINQVSREEQLLEYHTHMLYQFSKEQRKAFRAMLDEIGKERNYKYLAVEANAIFDRVVDNGKGVKIELTEYVDGERRMKTVGETDGHANWIRWIS